MSVEFRLLAHIFDQVPASEHDEVRRILGVSLIDRIEDLQREIDLLLEIWQEYRQETDLQQHEEPAQPSLPEPPLVRATLSNEIRFFAKQLGNSKSIKEVEDVVRYVQEDRPRSSPCDERPRSARPQTAKSLEGRELPVRGASANSALIKHNTSQIDQHVTAVREGAEASAIAHIRQALEQEADALADDTEFLRQCLDGEADYRSSLAAASSASQAPSIQQLRTARHKLEKAYLSRTSNGDTSTAPPTATRNLPKPPTAMPPPRRPVSSRRSNPRVHRLRADRGNRRALPKVQHAIPDQIRQLPKLPGVAVAKDTFS
eukprot:TRINITY_DN6801_c0_g1_i1.p1 TRINITY_DN6801_c0_g1~~TRINITY_DN6801_c0_g1_i1.p1  ORF type:complete len:317 (+),score=66.83 TRINITY_DN6801_c0_g1_i1:143-1093(+)